MTPSRNAVSAASDTDSPPQATHRGSETTSSDALPRYMNHAHFVRIKLPDMRNGAPAILLKDSPPRVRVITVVLLRFKGEPTGEPKQQPKKGLWPEERKNYMKKLAAWLAMFALIAACSTAFAGDDKSDKAVGNLGNPGVLPPQSMAFGKSYGEWSKEWWLYTMPKGLDVNPFGYGTDGTLGQSGNVWLLGGTFVGPWDNTITRDITIPAGTALFFPVMNVECSTIETEASGFHGDNEAELRECAKGWADQMVAGNWGPLFCIVDGVVLQNVEQYRCSTPLINITLPAMAADNNIFFVPVAEGTQVSSVGDGIYIMLTPLAVGTHSLVIPNVSYTIHVVPASELE